MIKSYHEKYPLFVCHFQDWNNQIHPDQIIAEIKAGQYRNLANGDIEKIEPTEALDGSKYL